MKKLLLAFAFTLCLVNTAAAVTELWIKNYTGASYDDGANGVAVDSSNNIIVTGYSDNVAGTGNWDYLTIKYDEGGNVVWMKNYTGTSDDEAWGVAVDSLNNIIVTGNSWNVVGTGNQGYLTIKYDEDGTVLWMKNYTGASSDVAYGVAVDSLNNILVTGYSHNAAGTGNWDYLTIKYDEGGNVVWMKNYTGTGDDVAYGVAVDSSNNIIVTGWSYDAAGPGTYYNYLTIKYGSDTLPPSGSFSGVGQVPESPLAALAIIVAAMAIGAFLILRRP
jgi:hypothetical protein